MLRHCIGSSASEPPAKVMETVRSWFTSAISPSFQMKASWSVVSETSSLGITQNLSPTLYVKSPSDFCLSWARPVITNEMIRGRNAMPQNAEKKGISSKREPVKTEAKKTAGAKKSFFSFDFMSLPFIPSKTESGNKEAYGPTLKTPTYLLL